MPGTRIFPFNDTFDLVRYYFNGAELSPEEWASSQMAEINIGDLLIFFHPVLRSDAVQTPDNADIYDFAVSGCCFVFRKEEQYPLGFLIYDNNYEMQFVETALQQMADYAHTNGETFFFSLCSLKYKLSETMQAKLSDMGSWGNSGSRYNNQSGLPDPLAAFLAITAPQTLSAPSDRPVDLETVAWSLIVGSGQSDFNSLRSSFEAKVRYEGQEQTQGTPASQPESEPAVTSMQIPDSKDQLAPIPESKDQGMSAWASAMSAFVEDLDEPIAGASKPAETTPAAMSSKSSLSSLVPQQRHQSIKPKAARSELDSPDWNPLAELGAFPIPAKSQQETTTASAPGRNFAPPPPPLTVSQPAPEKAHLPETEEQDIASTKEAYPQEQKLQEAELQEPELREPEEPEPEARIPETQKVEVKEPESKEKVSIPDFLTRGKQARLNLPNFAGAFTDPETVPPSDASLIQNNDRLDILDAQASFQFASPLSEIAEVVSELSSGIDEQTQPEMQEIEEQEVEAQKVEEQETADTAADTNVEADTEEEAAAETETTEAPAIEQETVKQEAQAEPETLKPEIKQAEEAKSLPEASSPDYAAAIPPPPISSPVEERRLTVRLQNENIIPATGVHGLVLKLEQQAQRAATKLESKLEEIRDSLSSDLEKEVQKVVDKKEKGLGNISTLRNVLSRKLSAAADEVQLELNEISDTGSKEIADWLASALGELKAREEKINQEIIETFETVLEEKNKKIAEFVDSSKAQLEQGLAKLNDLMESTEKGLHEAGISSLEALQTQLKSYEDRVKIFSEGKVGHLEALHARSMDEIRWLSQRGLTRLEDLLSDLSDSINDVQVQSETSIRLRCASLSGSVMLSQISEHREKLEELSKTLRDQYRENLEQVDAQSVSIFPALISERKKKVQEILDETCNSLQSLQETHLAASEELLFNLNQFIETKNEEVKQLFRQGEDTLAVIESLIQKIVDATAIEQNEALLIQRQSVMVGLERIGNEIHNDVTAKLRTRVVKLEDRGRVLQEELISGMEAEAYNMRRTAEGAINTIRQSINEAFEAIQRAQDSYME